MIYEFRKYHVFKGRMDAMRARFFDHAIALFSKHDIKTIDFWDDAEGKDFFYYILEHPDMDSRNRNFEAFIIDSEWDIVARRSELDGPIVEKVESFFMKKIPGR